MFSFLRYRFKGFLRRLRRIYLVVTFLKFSSRNRLVINMLSLRLPIRIMKRRRVIFKIRSPKRLQRCLFTKDKGNCRKAFRTGTFRGGTRRFRPYRDRRNNNGTSNMRSYACYRSSTYDDPCSYNYYRSPSCLFLRGSNAHASRSSATSCLYNGATKIRHRAAFLSSFLGAVLKCGRSRHTSR